MKVGYLELQAAAANAKRYFDSEQIGDVKSLGYFKK